LPAGEAPDKELARQERRHSPVVAAWKEEGRLPSERASEVEEKEEKGGESAASERDPDSVTCGR